MTDTLTDTQLVAMIEKYRLTVTPPSLVPSHYWVISTRGTPGVGRGLTFRHAMAQALPRIVAEEFSSPVQQS